jgi:hypothetical protein
MKIKKMKKLQTLLRTILKTEKKETAVHLLKPNDFTQILHKVLTASINYLQPTQTNQINNTPISSPKFNVLTNPPQDNPHSNTTTPKNHSSIQQKIANTLDSTPTLKNHHCQIKLIYDHTTISNRMIRRHL